MFILYICISCVYIYTHNTHTIYFAKLFFNVPRPCDEIDPPRGSPGTAVAALAEPQRIKKRPARRPAGGDLLSMGRIGVFYMGIQWDLLGILHGNFNGNFTWEFYMGILKDVDSMGFSWEFNGIFNGDELDLL